MSKHINELATEEESKRGAGRPTVNNRLLLEKILSDEELAKQFRSQIAHLVDKRRGILANQDLYKDDVKATKEVFGLSSGYITKAVDTIIKDEIDDKIEEASQFGDLLNFLKQNEEGEEFDEYD